MAKIDIAQLRELLAAEVRALQECRDSGTSTDKLDAWIKASGRLSTALREALPGILDELETAALRQSETGKDEPHCKHCGDSRTITDRVDEQITCPDCGYPNSPLYTLPAPAADQGEHEELLFEEEVERRAEFRRIEGF